MPDNEPPEEPERDRPEVVLPVEDHLDLRRIDPTYRVYFGDGSTLDLTSDLAAMQAQLEAIEPGSFGGFLRYLDEGELHYRLALPHLVARDFRSPSDFVNLKNLLLLFKLKLLTKHYGNVGKYFRNHRLKAAFTFQDMYMSLSPYEAPATFSLLQHTEFADGVWFPMGGMYRLVEALTSIAEKSGARFLYNAPVEHINLDGRQATGVTLADGRQIQADIVVANADLPYVYRCLLPDDGTSGRLERKRYTYSTVTFCWGVDKQYPQLGPHNVFIARDFRQSLDHVFRDLTLPDEPSFYVHAPVRVDPSLAPKGHDTLTAVVPVGHINDAAPQDWAAIEKRARQLVRQLFQRAQVHLVVEHREPSLVSRAEVDHAGLRAPVMFEVDPVAAHLQNLVWDKKLVLSPDRHHRDLPDRVAVHAHGDALRPAALSRLGGNHRFGHDG